MRIESMDSVKWKIAGLYKASAQAVANEIGELGIGATPAMIVKRAEDPTSELHKCFTWNDSEAAQKYREIEAQKVVRMLVRIEPQAEQKAPQRLFYVTKENEGYKPIAFILERPDERAALLERAKSELQAFKRKYDCLQELTDVFQAIDRIAS